MRWALVVTSGGGGGGLDPQEICDGSALSEARQQRCVHHHVTVDPGGDSAEVWAREMDGTIFDRVRVYPDGTHEALRP